MLGSLAPVLAQSNRIPSPNLTAPPASDRSFPEAPIGHRQPRASAVSPSAPAATETPQEAAAREDAALDRKIKGICRGC
jgi:hypothetical protein